jgi:aspartate/glutamate racemase
MTQLLQKALEEVYKLPSEEQNIIAQLILDELEDERLWEETFAASEEKLSRLADKVRQDIREGRTKPLGIDEL